MKTYRQREKQGSKVQESTKGPDEAKIKVKLDLGSCNEIKCNHEIRCSRNIYFFGWVRSWWSTRDLPCRMWGLTLRRTGFSAVAVL